jgi:hypothetical protein
MERVMGKLGGVLRVLHSTPAANLPKRQRDLMASELDEAASMLRLSR